MNHELEDALEKQDWADIFKRLTAYAKRRLGRKANIEDAKELAGQAIEQLLDPDHRDWDPETGSLIWHLQSNVNGIISNRKRTKSRTGERLRDFGPETSDERFWDRDDPIKKIDAEKVFDAVLERASEGKNELVQRMLLEALDLVVDPKKLAERLGEPIGRIYEARRKFHEYLEAVLQEQEE